MPAPIVIAYGNTRVGPEAVGEAFVTASHCRLCATDCAANLHVASAIFNNADVGHGHVEIGALDYLQEFDFAAATFGHDTAPIGDKTANLVSGIMTETNGPVASLAVCPDKSCRDAAAVLQPARPCNRRLTWKSTTAANGPSLLSPSPEKSAEACRGHSRPRSLAGT